MTAHAKTKPSLPAPPSWLADVPDDLIRPSARPGYGRPERLLAYLRSRGLPTPSLLDLEAERTRRGMRPGLRIGDYSAPMPLGPLTSPRTEQAHAHPVRRRRREAAA